MAKNDIKIGSSELSNIAIGNNDVDKVYLGKDLVWERYNCTVNLSRALTKGEKLVFEGDLACSFSEGEKSKSLNLNLTQDTFTLGYGKDNNINNCNLVNIINDGIVEPYNIKQENLLEFRLYHNGVQHNIDVMLFDTYNIFVICAYQDTEVSKCDFIISLNGIKYHIIPNQYWHFNADWAKEKSTNIDIELIEVNNREKLSGLYFYDVDLLKTPKFSQNVKKAYGYNNHRLVFRLE